MKEMITENTRKQRDHTKTGKLSRKLDARRIAAEVRNKAFAAAKATEKVFLGTKEKVKANVITACEGLAVTKPGTNTYNWLERRKKKMGCVKVALK